MPEYEQRVFLLVCPTFVLTCSGGQMPPGAMAGTLYDWCCRNIILKNNMVKCNMHWFKLSFCNRKSRTSTLQKLLVDFLPLRQDHSSDFKVWWWKPVSPIGPAFFKVVRSDTGLSGSPGTGTRPTSHVHLALLCCKHVRISCLQATNLTNKDFQSTP